MSFRRLTTLIVVLVGGAGVALWLAQNFVNTWEPELRARLEDGLSQTLQQRVHIDSVSLAFFNRFRIHNVQVWSTGTPPQLLFRAEDVSLTLSLIDLPRAIYRKRPLESVGLISVHAPYLELSPEILARAKVGRRASTPSVLPLLFTLAWDNGTIRWNGPPDLARLTTRELPAAGYAVTFHEAKGAFRIRGPKIDFVMRSRMDQSPLLRFEFSRFYNRWDARALISDGDIPGFLALAQTISHQTVVPAPWQTRGSFTLELIAGGKHLPEAQEKPWSFIEKGRLAFSGASLTLAPGLPPIFCEGAVIGREARWSSDGLKIGTGRSVVKVQGSALPFSPNGPLNAQITGRNIEMEDVAAALGRPGAGAGKTELAVEARGTLINPLVDIHLQIPSGRAGIYPLKSADVQAHYEKRQWTLANGSTQLWGGTLLAKGNFSAEENTLKVSGENLSIAAMLPSAGTAALDGRLNFSGSLTGPWNDPEMTGSLWAAHLAIGASPAVNARGDVDISRAHFEADLASDDQRFQLAIDGNHDDDQTTIERLHLVLPDGSSSEGHAAWSSRGSFSGEATAKDVPLPGLFLPLGRWTPGLAGTVNARVKLSGHTDHPKIQASLESSDLSAGGDALGETHGDFLWAEDRLSIPAFQVGSTVHGVLSSSGPHWMLSITAKDSPAEMLLRLEAPHATLPGTLSATVEIKADGLEVKDAHYTSPLALAQASGRAEWSRSPGSAHVDHLSFDAVGRAVSPQEGPLWQFPFRVSGHWSPRDTDAGEAELHVPSVQVRQKEGDPLDALIVWDHAHLSWNRAHWGTHWRSEGTMHFLPAGPAMNARLDLSDASAALAARWLGWPHPQEIDGALSGTCVLSGTSAAPSIEINTRLQHGRWRAFHLDSTIVGSWKKTGDSSVGLTGALDGGGPFTFRGVIHPDYSVEGNLLLNGLNLDALGQSLSFSQPLSGIVRGALAVRGPLKQLELAGHVEGGPMTYGAPGHHPFRLENYFLDIGIAPSPDMPGFTRVTMTKGLARTAEEEIRLRSGSYAEFADGREARLKIGTDLRNLHLGVFTLFGGLDLDGLWQIKPAGLEIKGDVTTRSLFINDYELEQGHVNADYYDDILQFSPPPHAPKLITGTLDFHKAPQLKFTDFLLSGQEGQGLQLSGDIGPSLWDFRMAGKGLDVGTLSDLAGFPYPLSGTANVAVRGTGDFMHPHLEGSLDLSQGSALGLAYASGQAAFVWQNDRITFTQLTLADPGRYKLMGSGSFPLISQQQSAPPRDPRINFSVRLVDSNLSLLQSLSNEVKKARGNVDGLLQITGTSDHPQLHGSLRVDGGDVVGAHYFKHLQNLLLSVDFAGDKVQLRELQGDSGSGTFLAGGTITLNGFIPSAYNLHADITSSKGLSVQVPELAIPESPLAKRFHFLTTISQADVKGHVTFEGPADSPVFKGQATISNGHFTFPASRKNPPPPALMEWFRRINWNVGLNFQDGAWFENEFVQASLIGNLRLKGPSDALRVDGSMDISQGEISYLGLEFNIRQARFDVVSDEASAVVTNTPFVSGVADSQVQATDTLNGGGTDSGNRLSFNDTITLTIDRAPVDEIKPRLTSANNPNLSQEKVLARATQIDMDNLTPQERTYVYQQQMIQVLDTSLATPLAKSFLKRTGLVDNFRVQRVIDPSGVSPVVASASTPNSLAPVSQNPFANTKYTVEKDLFNRVTVGYGVRFVPVLTPDLQDRLNLVSDVQLSYRWFKNVYVKGDVDLPNSNPGIVPERKVTIEPTFRFGWWGNTNANKLKPAATPAPATPAAPANTAPAASASH